MRKLLASLLLILAAFAFAARATAQTRTFCPNSSPTVLTSTLTLTSANNGQTFTNYQISTTSGPCIEISGATGITIQQSNIGPCGTNNSTAQSAGIYIVGGSGDNIFDNYIHVENLSSGGGDDHEGVLVDGANSITIQGNVLAFNETNIEINGGTSTGDVINGNFMLNPTGPFPRGQQFQSGSGTSNLTVENNRTLSCEQSACATHSSGTGVSCLLCSASTLSGDSFPFYALQEDAINIFGTTTSIETNNWVEGGDSPSGQGILIDSGSGGTTTITGNVLKDTGHGCIGPYGAGTVTIENNKCQSETYINSSQNGMYLYNPFSTSGTITAENNIISILYGTSSGTFDSGCNPATTSCYFNSYGNALGGGLTLNDLGGENYDNLYPAPIGGGTGSAYEALNPIATTNPPPSIPPEPESCVANSPYSQAVTGPTATPTATPTPGPLAHQTTAVGTTCSGSVAFPSVTVGAGDMLAAVASTNANTPPSISGVSDNNGGTWTCPIVLGSTSLTFESFCYSLDHPAGATIVSVAYASGSEDCVEVQWLGDVSGILTSSALDQSQSTGFQTSASFNSGTTGATSQADEFVIASFGDAQAACANVISGPTNGFTAATCVNENHGNNESQITAYLLTSASGTQSTGWTGAVDVAGFGLIASFKMAPTATPIGFFWP